jgi:porphobilinogen synthase
MASLAPSFTETFLLRRPRRNRQTAAIRALVQETILLPQHLVAPLFIKADIQQEAISSMPGVFRYGLHPLVEEARELYKLGIRAIDLFCFVPEGLRDGQATEARRRGNFLEQAIIHLKNALPELCIMVDIALDPFTDHGHDGLIDMKGHIDNDSTLYALGEMALIAAQAGADIVAPSDMMDGRVAYLRQTLDQAGFTHVGILSYAAKYASAFYGPFRDALASAPKWGDKKTYQMNPANQREALLECTLDEQEGADMLLIKPALCYLDIIAKVRAISNLPIGAYHVSGEYSMVMAAAQRGWLDADRAFYETLLSIKRAGADFILTYAAHRIAQFIAAAH